MNILHVRLIKITRSLCVVSVITGPHPAPHTTPHNASKLSTAARATQHRATLNTRDALMKQSPAPPRDMSLGHLWYFSQMEHFYQNIVTTQSIERHSTKFSESQNTKQDNT